MSLPFWVDNPGKLLMTIAQPLAGPVRRAVSLPHALSRSPTARPSERVYAVRRRGDRAELHVLEPDKVRALTDTRGTLTAGVADALLRDVLGRRAPEQLLREFTHQLLSAHAHSDFTLDEPDVRAWVDTHQQRRHVRAGGRS